MTAMLLTHKLGMISIVDQQGSMIPLTVLQATDNLLMKIKTVEQDGYQALVLGTGQAKKPARPLLGQFKKLGDKPCRVIKEVRLDKPLEADLKPGDKLTADSFAVGDKVCVVAKSKGKGFAGVIKRHNFNTQRKSHGGKGTIRKPGSVGSIYPQRILKGKKMAGRMGNRQVTMKNLEVALVDSKRQIIGLKGAVPGAKKGLVILKKV